MLSVGASLFVALFPLFSVNCIQGHDLSYHLLRIEALKEGILAGRPFLKVNLLYFGGRGYASSLFYPDMLLYFPALLRCLGVGIGASYHLFVAFCIILAAASMFLSIRAIALHFCKGDPFKAEMAGAVSAISYTLAQYHLDDIYTRSAVGEYTAMIFIPILLYGIYDILMGEMKRPLLMAAGFSGLLLCHTTTTFFMLVFYLLLFVYAFVYRCIRGRMRLRWLLRIAVAALSSLLLTAFYWVPVLEMLTSSRFQTDAAGFDLNYERLMLKDVFVNKNPAMGAALPVICLVLFLLSFVMVDTADVSRSMRSVGDKARSPLTDGKKLRYLANTMAVAAFFFTIGSTGFLPWAKLQGVLGFVQFPWRLFVTATPLYCGAIALYICCIPMWSDEVRYGGVVTVLAVMSVSALAVMGRVDEGYYSYSDDYYSYVPYTGSVIGGEWLPAAASDRSALLKGTDTARTSYGGEIGVDRNAGVLSFRLETDVRYVDVPIVFYRGYTAVSESGERLKVSGDGKNGDMRIYLAPAGVIKVFYEGTVPQHVSSAVSCLFLGALAFLIPARRRRSA